MSDISKAGEIINSIAVDLIMAHNCIVLYVYFALGPTETVLYLFAFFLPQKDYHRAKGAKKNTNANKEGKKTKSS
jgi:hypothetical protein